MRRDSQGNLSLFTSSHGLAHVFFLTLAALLPLIRLEFQLSYTEIGIITFILGLITALASLPAGLLCDRFNQVKLVFLMFLLAGILAGLLPFSQGLFSTLTLLGLLSLSLSLFHPSAHSYLSQRYPARRGEIFGIYEVGGTVGMVIAPVMAGFLGSNFGWRTAYGFWAIPALLIALWIYFFPQAEDEKDPTNRDDWNPSKEFLSGIKLLYHHKMLKFTYLAQGFSAFIFGGMAAFLPIFLVDKGNFSVRGAGYLLALFLMGGAMGKIIGGRLSDRWGRGRTMGLSFLLMIPLLILVPLVKGISLIILLFALGVIYFMILPAIIALIGDITDEKLGFNYGLQALVGFSFASLSRLFCGILGDNLGLENIFFLFAAVAFLGTVYSFSRLPTD